MLVVALKDLLDRFFYDVPANIMKLSLDMAYVISFKRAMRPILIETRFRWISTLMLALHNGLQ